MKSIEIAEAGGPEVLRYVDRADPVPGPGEVLIRVAAAGLNGHDLHHRDHGRHPLAPGESDLPGLEVAGTIVAVGEGGDERRVGDAVCALLRGGGYAELVVASEALCLPVPSGLSMVEAASIPEAAFTVWSNVFVEGRLREGERFLMNGGSSGIGVTAIQIASKLGYEVFATAGGPEKCALCENLGASLVVDYRTEDLVEKIMAATGNEGVDVVLEIIGGEYFAKDVELLRMDGRLLCIAAARGALASIDFVPVVRKRLVLTGSTLRPRSIAYKAEVASQLLEHVWPLYASGAVRPVIDSVYSLADAAEAHRRMESRAHAGKIMLQVGEP